MDLLTKNPGLQHVAEEIFQNLNVFALERCEEVSQSCKAILRKPSFWLQKCRNYDGDDSNKIRNAWKMAISMVKKKEDIKLEENLCDHLKMICKDKENYQSPIYWASEKGHLDIVKELATSSDNPNLPDHWINGRTPILLAAMNGHVEIIKVLAPLTDNPNEPNAFGTLTTPIHVAVWIIQMNQMSLLDGLLYFCQKL